MTVRTPLVIISGKVQQLPSGDSISVGLVLTPSAVGFNIAGGTTSKTLTVSNSITLAGNDGTTLNIGAGGTLGSGAYATIANYALTNQTMYIGTTAVNINRASAALALTGITSIDGQAQTVVTNANLTGEVTSVGNAATVTNSAVISKVLTGYVAGSGTVTASDTILQAIQKLGAGGAGAVGGGTDKLFYENDVVVSQNYTIGSGAYVSGVTITQASPAVFTLASHGFVAGSQVILSTTGALLTGLSVGVPYYVITAGLTSGAFEVSSTLGGAAINTTGTQSGVHSVAKVKNAMSSGPISIADGVVVTINSGSVWSIV